MPWGKARQPGTHCPDRHETDVYLFERCYAIPGHALVAEGIGLIIRKPDRKRSNVLCMYTHGNTGTGVFYHALGISLNLTAGLNRKVLETFEA